MPKLALDNVLFHIASSTGIGFTTQYLRRGKQKGNRVQITNCRATVSNNQVFIGECPLPQGGKGDENVTSQETCLFR